jgi:glutathione S-transferase
MKLYYLPGACSLAPHIVCEWLKTPYELARADLKDPEFKRINPMLAVPALTTETLGTLTQAGAILRYLATLPGGASFGPDGANAREVYEFDHWECFFTGDVHPAFFPFFTPQRYTTETSEAALAGVRAAGPALVERGFALLDAHLAQRSYIVGERLTFLDAYAVPMVRWVKTGMADTFAKFPAIRRHYAMMCDDPGVRAAMNQQGIKP